MWAAYFAVNVNDGVAFAGKHLQQYVTDRVDKLFVALLVPAHEAVEQLPMQLNEPVQVRKHLLQVFCIYFAFVLHHIQIDLHLDLKKKNLEYINQIKILSTGLLSEWWSIFWHNSFRSS